MHGFITSALGREFEKGLQYFSNALDVLRRGRKIWRDVSKEQRGTIFEETFIRGVRVLHLEATMQASVHFLRSMTSPFTEIESSTPVLRPWKELETAARGSEDPRRRLIQRYRKSRQRGQA